MSYPVDHRLLLFVLAEETRCNAEARSKSTLFTGAGACWLVLSLDPL
jgi:hypothetical protein